MLFQYAMKEYVPLEGISPDEITHWNYSNSTIEFHPVHKNLAEADETRGVVAIFNNEGERVSDWVKLDDEIVSRAFNQKSPASTRKDRLGSELAVRDFVMYCEFDGTSLYVGQVAGFTAKSVRVITYKYHQAKVKMVEPEKLTRIHPSVISE